MRTLIVVTMILGQVLCGVSRAAGYPGFDASQADVPINLSEYTIVWADEFDSLRAVLPGQGNGHWFPGVHAVLVAGEKMASLPDLAYGVSSGVLSMSTRLDPTDSKRVEAHLQTSDGRGNVLAFQNGYFEARMWSPAARGSHAGLWLLSEEKGLGHIEVDVVETYGVDDFAVHASTHVWPIAPRTHEYKSTRVVRRDIFDGFHLYGLLATDDFFVFYYDRKEIARIARLPEQRVPLYLLLSVFGNPTQPLIEPATLKVDYIRIYASKTAPRPPTDFRTTDH